MDTLWHDLRYAARQLLRSPGFTAVAVLTLALGIGANTAIFSVVNAVLFRPLPYAEPDRLFVLFEQSRQIPFRTPSYLTFRDYREQGSDIGQMGYVLGESGSLPRDRGAARFTLARVSEGFFGALGATPYAGRLFLPEEEQADGTPPAVLSYAFWRQEFGGDPAVLGRTVRTANLSYTIVGVLPPGAAFPSWAELYTPLASGPRAVALTHRDVHVDAATIVRLRTGLTVEAARARLGAIGSRLAAAYPADNAGFVGNISSLRDSVLSGGISTPLLLLLSATVLVLLIACVNVANLFLARLDSRSRELALRTALGAGRGRLVRQLLTESLVLASLGGMLGLLMAQWTLGLLTDAAGANLLASGASGLLPRLEEIRVDVGLFVITAVVSLLAGLATGLLPAWRGSGRDIALLIKSGGQRGSSPRRARLRRGGLIAGQVALTVVLLIGTALLIRSLTRLLQVDPGFRPDGVLTVHVFPSSPRYSNPASDVSSLYTRLVDATSLVPGVLSVGLVNHLPMAGAWSGSRVEIDGKPAEPGHEETVGVRVANVEYLRSMEIPLSRGRWFSLDDMTPTGRGGIVINHAMAEQFWPGQNPIGHRVQVFKSAAGRAEFGEPVSAEVVGVVGDVRQFGLDQQSDAAVYLPYTVNPWGHMFLTIQTTGDPARLTEPVRRALLGVDPDLMITSVAPMSVVLSDSLVLRRITLSLLGAFAGCALLLAAIGLYGVLSHAVGQRAREIGIRRAVGAGTGNILRMVIGEGMSGVASGAVIGIAGGWLFTRMLTGLLYQTSSTDPMAYLSAVGMLLPVALFAAGIPARRATRVDPMVALRSE
ncbi:MAG: ABC transporter permease [Gemmatimonadota bacterium]